jgi:dihydrofolate reductase
MTRTIYYVASSADGFIADADGKLAWLTRFDGAEGVREHYERFLAGVGALAMGARTYAFLLEASPATFPYPELPTWVFTNRQLPVYEGADLRFTKRSAQQEHEQLAAAAQGRNVWLMGGGLLAAQFAEAGLIDELRLSIAPALLGAGSPLLPMAGMLELTLREVTRFSAGLVELAYDVKRA